jgi:AmmeMemoRadiSam system protein A
MPESIREARSGDWTPGLSEAEQVTLFRIARETLVWCTAQDSTAFDVERYDITERLRVPFATFVTLKAGGHLRGCIGSLEPIAPLFESVHDNALNAALRDPRFRPVRSDEVPGLEIHVSILSPIVSIASPDDFKLGEHGIILEKGHHRAVYLPEVAVEQGWTREETLTSLSQKAGLPGSGWRSGAGFSVFSSVVLAAAT